MPIVATYVQFAAGAEAGNYGRALYSAFDASKAATPFYIPTVLLNQFNTTSQIGVQNIETFAITAKLTFKQTGQPDIVSNVNIPAQSSNIFMPNDIAGMRNPFNGSLVIEATQQGNAAVPGRVVAASQEGSVAGRAAYAFEGVAGGSTQIFMASMLSATIGLSSKSCTTRFRMAAITHQRDGDVLQHGWHPGRNSHKDGAGCGREVVGESVLRGRRQWCVWFGRYLGRSASYRDWQGRCEQRYGDSFPG